MDKIIDTEAANWYQSFSRKEKEKKRENQSYHC
jgi:hypothetical protein